VLVVLGCGYTGVAVARTRLARGERVVGTRRDRTHHAELAALGVEPRATLEGVEALVDEATDVLVAFPPDGETDAHLAPRIAHARAIVYLSSTTVYGTASPGPQGSCVDDTTPPRPESPRAERRLAAEAHWRAVAATVLRAPAIYGPDRGLPTRIRAGRHRVPGDGAHWVSRVHVEDLARFVEGAFATPSARGDCFVVGDLEPALHRDVVAFVCAAWGCPLPPHVPLAEADESLRADRRVDPSRALAVLGVTLRYPSYRDGMRPV
jgi:nucleoside-diphosphate-sugar epimerase